MKLMLLVLSTFFFTSVTGLDSELPTRDELMTVARKNNSERTNKLTERLLSNCVDWAIAQAVEDANMVAGELTLEDTY